MSGQALSGEWLPLADNQLMSQQENADGDTGEVGFQSPPHKENPARIYISARSGINDEDSSQRKTLSSMEVIARSWRVLHQLPEPNFTDMYHDIEREFENGNVTRQLLNQRKRDIRSHYLIDQTPWHLLTKSTVLELLHCLEFRMDLTKDSPARTAAEKRGVGLRRHPSTLNGYISILKGVAKESWLQGLMGVNTYQAIASVPFRKNHKEEAGRMVKNDELAALLNDCDKDKQVVRGLRDAAIISVMRGAGLRRKEVVSLRINHFVIPEDGSMPYLSIIGGKGNKDRQCFLTKQTTSRLIKWLSVRAPEWNDTTSYNEEHLYGFIFVALRKGVSVGIKPPKKGTNWLGGLTSNAIRYILEARRQSLIDSGVMAIKPFSPHDLRRSYCTDLLSQGMDIFTVQNLMGHSNVETTRRYDLRDDTQEREAIEQLSRNAEQGGYL